jgi:uncharacterized protein (TIGR02391 family)
VNGFEVGAFLASIGRRISGDLAEFARPDVEVAEPSVSALDPDGELLAEYDHRVRDVDLREATRSRFVSRHYADAVEAGVKALNECVRHRTGRTEDGDALMTLAFSPNGPLLRINAGRSKNDESEQRGHMFLCQGVVGAWRNPRAHSLLDDSPSTALMMLETLDSLMSTTKRATRTRRRKP